MEAGLLSMKNVSCRWLGICGFFCFVWRPCRKAVDVGVDVDRGCCFLYRKVVNVWFMNERGRLIPIFLVYCVRFVSQTQNKHKHIMHKKLDNIELI